MKLIKCPKCGEMYSDSYRTCPFCQEDEALKGRSAAPRRKVTRRRRAPSILGPAMVLVVVLAAVLVGVLLFGGKGNAEKPDDPAVVEPDPAPTTPLTLDQTTLNLNQAETATLTVTGAEDVLWTSSDTNVATVDDTGLVTAGIPGTATITVTTADGSQSAACTVNVATPLPEPPEEKLGLRSIYQDKGETINEFSAKVGSTVQMRVDGTEQTVTWTIEDTKIATVDANGLVTAVAKGKTILKATRASAALSSSTESPSLPRPADYFCGAVFLSPQSPRAPPQVTGDPLPTAKAPHAAGPHGALVTATGIITQPSRRQPFQQQPWRQQPSSRRQPSARP